MNYTLNTAQSTILLDAITGTGAVNSDGFAVPGGNRPVIVWQTIFAGSPTGVDIHLQGAMNNTDSEYFDIDISDNMAGELKHIGPVSVRWIRARQVSRTGGTTTTVQVNLA